MLYTIHGFQQEVLVEFGCDAIDALFLRWFADFIHTGKMETLIEGEKIYYWINHQYVISQNPIMEIKSVESFSRRLRKMEKQLLLFSQEKKLQGKTKKFYRFNPEVYERLTFHTRLKSRVSTQANDSQELSHPIQKEGVHPIQKEGVHPTQKSSNSSIKEILLSGDSKRGGEEEKPKIENELSGKPSHATSPPPLIYFLSFFSLSEKALKPYQIKAFEQITDKQVFQEACNFWRDKAYNPLNLKGLFERYQRLCLKNSSETGCGKLSEEPPSSYASRLEPPMPLPLSKDEREAKIRTGEQKAREYFQSKGWSPAKIEEQVKQIRQALGGR